MSWLGNITIKMDNKEDTYGPGSIEVKKGIGSDVSLKFTTIGERASAEIKFSKEDCKVLISKLIVVL